METSTTPVEEVGTGIEPNPEDLNGHAEPSDEVDCDEEPDHPDCIDPADEVDCTEDPDHPDCE